MSRGCLRASLAAEHYTQARVQDLVDSGNVLVVPDVEAIRQVASALSPIPTSLLVLVLGEAATSLANLPEAVRPVRAGPTLRESYRQVYNRHTAAAAGTQGIGVRSFGLGQRSTGTYSL